MKCMSRGELCAWGGLHGRPVYSMLPAQARLISLAAGFVPNFDAGPSAHAVAVVRALSPAQVWGPCILPQGDGVEQPGSDAVKKTIHKPLTVRPTPITPITKPQSSFSLAGDDT